MSAPTVIDTHMHGLAGITGVFLLQGETTALVETGPKSSVDHVLFGLTDEGVDHLDWIIVTHIHLDHAGAAGTLAQHFPEARVAVHEVGAPHLVDPSKLWSSAGRIYGDAMEKLWGGIDPLDADRIVPLSDGDSVDLGDRKLQAVDTPGHAAHHHAFLDTSTGIAFVGDALGVRLRDVGVMRPATPPPEFNLMQAVDSINRIHVLQPSSVYLTHFGAPDEANPVSVGEVCDEAADALLRWGEWVRDARDQTRDLDEVTRLVTERSRADMGRNLDDEALDRMDQTTSYWMNTSGYMRYFDKQEKSTQ
jgi:glyoxylase-like metal-dependent hydrolase (beta-lactamase superfamily II)